MVAMKSKQNPFPRFWCFGPLCEINIDHFSAQAIDYSVLFELHLKLFNIIDTLTVLRTKSENRNANKTEQLEKFKSVNY